MSSRGPTTWTLSGIGSGMICAPHEFRHVNRRVEHGRVRSPTVALAKPVCVVHHDVGAGPRNQLSHLSHVLEDDEPAIEARRQPHRDRLSSQLGEDEAGALHRPDSSRKRPNGHAIDVPRPFGVCGEYGTRHSTRSEPAQKVMHRDLRTGPHGWEVRRNNRDDSDGAHVDGRPPSRKHPSETPRNR